MCLCSRRVCARDCAFVCWKAGTPWLGPQTHMPAGKLLMRSWTSHIQSCTCTYAADIARSLVVIDGCRKRQPQQLHAFVLSMGSG